LSAKEIKKSLHQQNQYHLISTLTMKILRTNFVTHTMINCLQPNYIPLNPEKYGWQKLDDMWVPLWFEGPPLPSLHELDELDNAHEDVDTNINADDAADGESSDDDWPISDNESNDGESDSD
jgi:hypothetical protein